MGSKGYCSCVCVCQTLVWISLKTASLQRYAASCIVCRPFLKPRIRVSIAHVFSKIRARVAPRVLHFSASEIRIREIVQTSKQVLLSTYVSHGRVYFYVKLQ